LKKSQSVRNIDTGRKRERRRERERERERRGRKKGRKGNKSMKKGERERKGIKGKGEKQGVQKLIRVKVSKEIIKEREGKRRKK
jgi:hypothetical protein